jgi:hypothetical protein
VKLALSSTVAAPRERVYEALLDPAVLQRCIPGCESLVETAPDTYAATLKVGVAGMKGSYTGRAAIANRQPPDSLTLTVDGKGGPGFVKGTAVLSLSPDGGSTRVACEADVQVGGLIAAVGSRLVEAAARKMADDFFRQLAVEIGSAKL